MPLTKLEDLTVQDKCGNLIILRKRLKGQSGQITVECHRRGVGIDDFSYMVKKTFILVLKF